MIMNLEKYNHLGFFTGLCAAEIQLLAPFFSHQTWVAGTVIFEQGDFADYLYLVGTGEVTLRYKPDDGPVMNMTRVMPGSVFGWSAAMGNPVYTSAAVCTLDSEVLRIRGSDLRTLSEKHPDLGKVILERLSANIAARQISHQGRVNSILANGMRQQPED